MKLAFGNINMVVSCSFISKGLNRLHWLRESQGSGSSVARPVHGLEGKGSSLVT